VLVLREEEEAFDNRGNKLYKRIDRKTSSEEFEHQRSLGVPINYFDFDPAQGTPEQVCEQLNKLSIFFDYKPFSVGDGRYQIVQALLPLRKVSYPRMAVYLRKVVKPLVLKKYTAQQVTKGMAEAYFDSMTVYEKMREAQKLFADPTLADRLYSNSIEHISKEEIELIIYLQPADEVQVQADVDSHKRQLTLQQKIHSTADGVKVKSSFRSPRNQLLPRLPLLQRQSLHERTGLGGPDRQDVLICTYTVFKCGCNYS